MARQHNSLGTTKKTDRIGRSVKQNIHTTVEVPAKNNNQPFLSYEMKNQLYNITFKLLLLEDRFPNILNLLLLLLLLPPVVILLFNPALSTHHIHWVRMNNHKKKKNSHSSREL